ncbi:splA/ryanodine receptor domain and SOCS box containing 2 [Rhinolophus ferrumequinum]|uniref:SplA/ryanodine receptor domain and SOCS box containing 2 n=1 Tax=Rhinolophus ferrumequinum TaxID=59479 RepID=A0A7J7WT02_RHIFE|nr:splA/ryanodine receptor domain and SOCS box containing 2 [Rhinolophus ferrumequinum]
MGQTALAGGNNGTLTSQALCPDLSCPEGLEELLSAPPPDLGTQRRHGWNPKDCSENIEVKEEGLCFERRPVAQSTDGARAEPHSLLHLSRVCVRQALGATRLGQVSALPLPPAMKRYLLYQ